MEQLGLADAEKDQQCDYPSSYARVPKAEPSHPSRKKLYEIETQYIRARRVRLSGDTFIPIKVRRS